MKRLLLSGLLLSTGLWADSTALTGDFKDFVLKAGIGQLNEQTYCYQSNGTIQGFQTSKPQRIASITKLLTTLLVSETVNLHKQYKTRIYVGKEAIHIEGGLDPYFEEEKLLLLMKALNDAGFKSFRTLSFTRNFLFYDLTLEDFKRITPEQTKNRLSVYLKAANKSFVASKWAAARRFAQEEGVTLDNRPPVLNVQSVVISDINPLVNENTLVVEHASKPLHRILKTMNVQSKNLVAENIYNEATRLKKLEALLQERGISGESFKIYNGSGLPIIEGKNRTDNLASCESVLKALALIEPSLKKQGLKLSDVIAINGGTDRGSFKTRFKDYPETHEAVISKTGTLKNASSLAGFMLSDRTIIFAILNHTVNIQGSRKLQDKFVSKMFDRLTTPKPEEYSKISIFPWDESEFLKPLR